MNRIHLTDIPEPQHLNKLSRKDQDLIWKEFVKTRLNLIARMQRMLRADYYRRKELEAL